MNPRPYLAVLMLLAGATAALWAGAASAQSTTVIQAENVRYEYAQVLRVTPVYQTLTATSIEKRCESPKPASEDSRLSRMVGAVKDVLTRDRHERERQAAAAAENCRSVPVEREFRQPIAYDVDYVYKGSKYRSRLPEDPGNRLRIRVAVTPVVAPLNSR
ncbi:hypothetical protein LVB77_09400 [Lysobacter sp. 5GHs7-4]|uniref:hypothetical protein n=1 Tax=Lysobacter sp. 5GHs7-4 TaxID=2904253 RepID=UPI001E5C4B23|nr:hypothetical protein [Lysobacter sp. 5GHs7-4]UHQ24865.1 hypothetical protein LVB77_09400 [Lysobacter sp. 5GHs7-4]